MHTLVQTMTKKTKMKIFKSATIPPPPKKNTGLTETLGISCDQSFKKKKSKKDDIKL